MRTLAGAGQQPTRRGQGRPPRPRPAGGTTTDAGRERSKIRSPLAASGDPAQGVAVRIYRPARSVAQAGKATSRKWLLELEPRWPLETEPLMGWTSSQDTLQQVKLTFPSREQAVAFAERQGWTCRVVDPHEPKFRPQRYADNFRWRPPPVDPPF